MRRAAVLGHPVAHSLSPALHRAAYDSLGLTSWRYEAFDVTEEQLPGFLAGLDDEWAGLSLTMPLKQVAVPLCVSVSPLAEALGVVNTVTLGPDGASGHNTDVEGIEAALRGAGVGAVDAAVVLGAGATAASAVAALAGLGCRRPRVLARSPERAQAVTRAAERLGVEPVVQQWGPDPDLSAEVVVSTVPAGAADAVAAGLLRDAVRRGVGPGALGVLLDVVYAPWPTALASAWDEAGGLVVSGLEMLVHQAVAQVELMTGDRPSADDMRDAGLRALADRCRGEG